MLSKGQFTKNIITFKIEDAVQEVLEIMKMRAELKGIRLFYDRE